MRYHEPWGAAKVNIRPRFDFDSNEPIQGEEVKKDTSSIWHFVIDYGLAINVVLVGAVIIDWFMTGGAMWMSAQFAKYAPALYTLITHGQM